MIINPPSELNWIEITSMIASVITTFIAGAALVSWKQQKNYELKMEALAASRKAKGLITLLRNPVSYGSEIITDIGAQYGVPIDRWTENDRNYLTFESRLKNNKELYDELFILREKVWAGYSDGHPYGVYFNFIIKTIQDIKNAHEIILRMSVASISEIPKIAEQLAKSREVILHMTGDAISSNLEIHYKKVVSTRKNKSFILQYWEKLTKLLGTSPSN